MGSIAGDIDTEGALLKSRVIPQESHFTAERRTPNNMLNCFPIKQDTPPACSIRESISREDAQAPLLLSRIRVAGAISLSSFEQLLRYYNVIGTAP